MAIINKNSITFNDTKPFNGLAVNAPLVVDKGADGSFAVAAHQIYWGNTFFNGSYLTTGTTQDLLTSIESACAGLDPEQVNQIIKDYLDENGVSIPEEYVTQSEINAMAYITASDVKNNIPAEYITETELNNKKFLTAIPSEYITETELSAKGYITAADVPAFEIPTYYITEKELEAMAYITASDVKNNIPAEYITETELNNKKFLTAIPSEYITETELAAKKYITLDEVPSQEIVASDLWENF